MQVAVPVPLPKLFVYRCEAQVARGVRVRVPFGRRRLVGVAMGRATAEQAQAIGPAVKPVIGVLDDAPVLPAGLLALLEWAAGYYHHPIGEVLATALPAALRRGEPMPGPGRHWRLLDADAELAPRATRQQALVQALATAPGGQLAESDLPAMDGRAQVLRALHTRGVIAPAEPVRRPPGLCGAAPRLNAGQQAAAEALAALPEGRFAPCLLDGVTGSGKTEVYCAAIADTLARGRQVLVLVPEIGLAPQLLQRLAGRFDAHIKALHSGETDGQRADTWAAAARGEVDILVGTRSAVFTPMPRLGLVVVDESHDTAYKQADGFRYSARDLAVRRAQMAGLPVVLGTATPSLETLHNVAQGRYTHLRLTERAGEAVPPAIELLDVRNLRMQDGLSQPLLGAVDACLRAGNQALVFVNRRGFAPTVLCHACGWVARCGRCDAHMTLHKRRGQLQCHHCGRVARPPAACPDCGSDELGAAGAGTQRLEAALAQRFPGIAIARIDRDTTRSKAGLQGQLADAASGKAPLLVGTQMLAKGHDFQRLTLVAVVDGDQGLFGADFRAPERMAQTLLQVAGRAGRGRQPGRVIIQTHHPDHPLLQRLASGDFHAFAQAALAERRAAGYPPFGHQAVLRAESVEPGPPAAFLRHAVRCLAGLGDAGVRHWDPVPAPMERKAGRWRWQLLLESEGRGPLHAALARLMAELPGCRAARRVRWSLDVDPQSLD